jgi:hypothetical protein
MIAKLKNKIFHILRYYDIINIDYKIKNQIEFGSSEANLFFKNSINKSNIFFEYGTGNSTLYACKRLKTFSVESDRNFYNFIKKIVIDKNIFFVNFYFVSFWSVPLFKNISNFFLKRKFYRYSYEILRDLIEKKIIPDLVLIDGRCRILCILSVYKLLANQSKNVTIIVDDFEKIEIPTIIKKMFNIETYGRLANLSFKDRNININKFMKNYSTDWK